MVPLGHELLPKAGGFQSDSHIGLLRIWGPTVNPGEFCGFMVVDGDLMGFNGDLMVI